MKKLLLVIGFFIALSTSAFAQGASVNIQCPTGQTTGTNQWTTCNSAHPLPVTSGSGPSGGAVEIFDGTNGPVAVKPASTGSIATDPSLVVQESPNSPLITAVEAPIPAGTNLIGNVGQLYPAGSTPITASATGTTTATTATLAANATLHTYICGFSIRANAAAAATNNSTVTGTVTGTLNYTQWTAPSASGIGLTEQIFSPCIISSAVNTGIAVVSGAPGTSGVVSVSAWGFQGPN